MENNFIEMAASIGHAVAYTIGIDGNGLSLLIFEEKWLNYISGPNSAPKSFPFWVRQLFNVCV